MANSEACAEFVKHLTTSSCDLENGKTSRAEDGESFTLLQNLLSNPIYQNLSAQQLINFVIGQQNNNKKVKNSNSTKMEVHSLANSASAKSCLEVVNGENCLGSGSLSSPAIDSGRDTPKLSLKKTPVGDVAADLLEEVTLALTKLQNSLNQGELALDESKKTALLSLVDRLIQGLISPSKNETAVDSTDSGVNETIPSEFDQPNTERRGSTSGAGRFAKRRNRNNRHTVGVTREELADARRIIEELELIGLQNAASSSFNKPKVTATFLNSNSAGVYNAILTRQISEPVTLLRPSQFLSQESLNHHPDNSKPYKVVLKQSISLDQNQPPASILKSSFKPEIKPATDTDDAKTKENILQRSLSGSMSKSFARTKNRIAVEKKTAVEAATTDDESDKSSTSDEDENDIKTKLSFKSFKARENYLRNQRSLDNSLNYSSGDEASASGARPSKYISKKMKMRRSNTVNLPKSFSFVNTFDVSDRECSDVESKESSNSKKLISTNVGLPTTIIGNTQPLRPPSFEAKTDNDKKFLAFIQKQNRDQVIPAYCNPTGERAAKTQNWTNKFGNLKNRFEGDETQLPPQSPQKPPINAAANFWKSIEKTKPSAKVSPMMSNQTSSPLPAVKSFPIVSDKFPWKTEKIIEKTVPMITNEDKNVSKKLQMLENSSKSTDNEKTPKVNHEINKLPASAFVPSNVNNFTHAPMSVFKPPISRKISNSFKPIPSSDEVVIKKSLPQVSNGIVRQIAENGFSHPQNVASIQPRKVTSSPTRNIASVDSAFSRVVPKSEISENQPVPWAGKPKTDRVMSLASSKFEQGVPTVHLNKTLESVEPSVKFRQNPLYNATYEKRASLPPNASFAIYEQLTSMSNEPKNVPPPKSDDTFVITDFTPSSVSTFAPPTRPTFARQDSLTNPEKEPLVLTCDRSTFAPKENVHVNHENVKISTSVSNENVMGISNGIDDDAMEYQAAVAKVMKPPVAHSAVVESSELVTLNDLNKENLMMKNIHDTLKKFSQKSPTPDFTKKRLSQDSSCSSLDMKRSSPRLSNDSSHSSIDSKLASIKIPIPAVPETAYSFTYNPSPPKIQVKSPSIDPPPHVRFNNVSNLQRTRSNYMLNVPHIDSRTSSSPSMSPVQTSRLSNFFTASQSPQPVQRTPEPMPMRLSEVRRFSSKSSLSRSKTMPSIPKKVELLDESNVEDAFEELLSSSNL